MLTSVTQPLPPAAQPQQPPIGPETWAGTDLVHATMRGDSVYGSRSQIQSSDFAGVSHEGGRTVSVPASFTRLDAQNLGDAITAAATLARTGKQVRMNFPDPDRLPYPTASPALALLQAADGAYYTSTLGNSFEKLAKRAYFLTIDSGIDSFKVTELTALHPDVKAVVGGNAWRNFSGEDVDVQLQKP